jgi:hypothetical protein
MDGGSEWERLSFLGRRLPRGFAIWAISVEPGCRRGYAEGEWRDAIVVVERGESSSSAGEAADSASVAVRPISKSATKLRRVG